MAFGGDGCTARLPGARGPPPCMLAVSLFRGWRRDVLVRSLLVTIPPLQVSGSWEGPYGRRGELGHVGGPTRGARWGATIPRRWPRAVGLGHGPRPGAWAREHTDVRRPLQSAHGIFRAYSRRWVVGDQPSPENGAPLPCTPGYPSGRMARNPLRRPLSAIPNRA